MGYGFFKLNNVCLYGRFLSRNYMSNSPIRVNLLRRDIGELTGKKGRLRRFLMIHECP
jgi:hypothetical protein